MFEQTRRAQSQLKPNEGHIVTDSHTQSHLFDARSGAGDNIFEESLGTALSLYKELQQNDEAEFDRLCFSWARIATRRYG